MNHFALTVLMPVYNAEKYLKEAIESILNQTFRDFELLIIDDGSQDSSVQIIQSFSDKRIRLVTNEKNLGISATLNKGIELSATELIARMDADDISYPDRLKLQYEYFQQHPETALLSTSVHVVSDKKAILEIFEVDKNYIYYNINFICPIYHPTVMYRRSVIMESGGYTVPYSEDYDLWWRLSHKYKIDHLEAILLDYRQSEKSLSNVTKKEEYDVAAREQFLRNIHFYTGIGFQLSFNEIECLRNEFEPMLKNGNVNEILTCIDKLDFINNIILNTKNINYKASDLLPSVKHKRETLIFYFYGRLPKHKALFLLYKTHSLKLIFTRLRGIFQGESS